MEIKEEKKEILIIEDDSDIRETVRMLLEGEGFLVTEAADGFEGIKKVTPHVSLIILDVMMPGKSGYETCEEIRRFSYVPILFLTAKSRDNDKILGLNAGGDDYLVKPFSFSELTARVNALLRRCGTYNVSLSPTDKEDDWISSCELRVNRSYNKVYVGEMEADLTETEYEILLLLMKYPNKVFSVQNIYESIWNEDFSSSYSNSVMVHVRNLRTKIEPNPQAPRYVLTIWGKGYRFGQ
ncbi:MAG: response regulator transcription factor [Lachnospiraceae bacterium]|nr:response regulator transcription factor [Lachnospiraceae bacterium]MBR3510399.1 response regulator transcription factor [Lachnospiraceae bacterium]MBR4605449.1 response regulator transcription factor [Lachnospiraceae bacterium]